MKELHTTVNIDTANSATTTTTNRTTNRPQRIARPRTLESLSDFASQRQFISIVVFVVVVVVFKETAFWPCRGGWGKDWRRRNGRGVIVRVDAAVVGHGCGG
jgi:hypothetical protein